MRLESNWAPNFPNHAGCHLIEYTSMPDSTTFRTDVSPNSPLPISVTKPWSRKFQSCLRCGTQTLKHRSRGLCVKCYEHEAAQQNKAHILKGTRTGRISHAISKDKLQHEYCALKNSLGDLARKYNCTRQYIAKLMNKYGINRRDKATARNLAVSKGKVAHTREDKFGNVVSVNLKSHTFNKAFFKSWSPDMAYVLGVIYTDGCLDGKLSRFSVSQKEPELLEKCLRLMESDAKIVFTEKRGIAGAIHHFDVYGKSIIEDLLKFGLKPNKSLTLEFPEIPLPYVRHFIRGCWDGDGSVYLEKNDLSRPNASFVSGSEKFATGIFKNLVMLGMPNVAVHKRTGKSSYQFRFRGPDCAKLFRILYDDVPESMYLNRKHERFEAISRYYSDTEPSTSSCRVRRGLGILEGTVLGVEDDVYVVKTIHGKVLRLHADKNTKTNGVVNIGDRIIARIDPITKTGNIITWSIRVI